MTYLDQPWRTGEPCPRCGRRVVLYADGHRACESCGFETERAYDVPTDPADETQCEACQ